MAAEEALYRNSVWSHENGGLALHSISDLETPESSATSNGTPPNPGLMSKFSADSDDEDYDDGYEDCSPPYPTNSPFSFISRRTERQASAAMQLPEPLLLRAYGRPHKHHALSGQQAPGSSIGEERQLGESPPNCVPRNDRTPQENPKAPSISDALLIVTICTAQLFARKWFSVIVFSTS